MYTKIYPSQEAAEDSVVHRRCWKKVLETFLINYKGNVGTDLSLFLYSFGEEKFKVVLQVVSKAKKRITLRSLLVYFTGILIGNYSFHVIYISRKCLTQLAKWIYLVWSVSWLNLRRIQTTWISI